jgi:hypothetical protein
MLAAQREEQLLHAMQLLKEESQRLVRMHREVMAEFDLLMAELNQIRAERQRQRGREFFSPRENSTRNSARG